MQSQVSHFTPHQSLMGAKDPVEQKANGVKD